MLKKFVKKIGKGIKKIGKKIGKPFKKLMKTKLGKVIGTIGMMMIGGWMLQGAKTFVGGMWQGQGVGQAFGNAIGEMGKAVSNSFKTITEGVTNMFGGEANATANATDIAKNIETGTQTIPPTSTTVSLEETALNTANDSTVVTGATGETTVVKDPKFVDPSKGVKPEITENIISEIPAPNETSILDRTSGQEFVEGTATDDFFDPTIKGERTIRPGRNLTDRIVRKATGQETFVDTLADFWHGDTKFKTIKDKTLGVKPFKSFENVPGFIREGTVGEGIALNQALASPPDPYIPGSSDMSGAISALSENEARLYSTMPMNQMMNQTSLPSPSVIGTADYLNNTRKAGLVWDTSLIATS